MRTVKVDPEVPLEDSSAVRLETRIWAPCRWTSSEVRESPIPEAKEGGSGKASEEEEEMRLRKDTKDSPVPSCDRA